MTDITVSSGQTVKDIPVQDQNMFVDSGGIAVTTRVFNSGYVYVSAGGKVSNTQFNSGGQVEVFAGGKAYGSVISGYAGATGTAGIQDVFGYASGTVANNLGYQYVEKGAKVLATTVNKGGLEYLSAGATDSGSIVNAGGTEYVSGGKSYGAVVSGLGGAIGGNGTIIGASIKSGSQEFLYKKGVSSDTILVDTAQEQVQKGAKAKSTTVSSGGFLYAEGGKTYGASVLSGGNETVFNKGVASGTLIHTAGVEFVSSGGTAFATKIEGGTLEIAGGGKTAGGIVFDGSGSEILIDSTKMPTAVISAFAAGNEIALGAVKYNKSDTVTVTAGVVTINAGKHKYALNIAGATAADPAYFISSGAAGEIVLTTTLVSASAAPMAFMRPAAPEALSATPRNAFVVPPPKAATPVPSPTVSSQQHGAAHELIIEKTHQGATALVSAHGGW